MVLTKFFLLPDVKPRIRSQVLSRSQYGKTFKKSLLSLLHTLTQSVIFIQKSSESEGGTTMTYSVMFEQITDASFPSGYYYAHIPALDLTTHGLGIEGAREAARNLVTAWLEEKRENNEKVPREGDTLFSKMEIEDAVLGS